MFNFKSFMDLVETNHSLGLAPSGSAAQVTPTSPEILDAAIPEGRRGVTAGAVGNWALLPIIVVRFHCSTYNDLGKMKLTASKMSRCARATVNSRKRIPREGRGDVGALVGVARVSAARVGCAMGGVGGIGFGNVGVGRVGVGIGRGKGTGSCKSCKDESRDDFELHIVFFLLSL